jgi:glycosyltransferase involved in cell wall biosynthesis
MSLKILFVNSSYTPNFVSGAERVVQRLAEMLVARGNEAVVVTGQPRGAKEIREVNGVRIIYTPVRNIYRPLTAESAAASAPLKAIWHLRDSYNAGMAHDVAQIIREEEPDVVNTHNLMGFSSGVIGGVREAGLHVAHTIHDQYLLCPRSTMFRRGDNCARQCLICKMYALPRKISTRHIGAVIGVSQFVLNRHIDFGYFPFATRHVIYNGIEIDERQEIVAQDRHPAFRFGFLGQIRPTKGLEQLIDAFSAMSASGIELHIAGQGDEKYERRLRQKTQDNVKITWRGYVNAKEFLTDIDVLVVPSLLHDTAPLVLMEAMKEGTPILGAIRGGIPEFVSEETGWLYDPSEPLALNHSLQNCVNSRERFPDMRRAARAMAKKFDDKKFLDAYLNVYQELSSRRQKT